MDLNQSETIKKLVQAVKEVSAWLDRGESGKGARRIMSDHKQKEFTELLQKSHNELTIEDLALAVKDGIIKLPPIQRDFVWKAPQIENLWDSILRGFPIGAFTATVQGQQILDGQQRLTAIALAFDDGLPFNDKNKSSNSAFKESYKNIQIFVDLIKPRRPSEHDTNQPSEHDNNQPSEEDSGENACKYIFRVITRYHPWGYDLINNAERLGADKKSKALNLYKEQKLIKEKQEYYDNDVDLRLLYPYSAVCPVPLRFLVMKNFDEVQWAINEWRKTVPLQLKSLPPEWPAEHMACYNEEGDRYKEKYYSNSKEGEKPYPPAYHKIEEMWKLVQDKIKAPGLAAWLFLKDTYDDELLFKRINRGGSPINDEDLNYSLLKSRLNRLGLNKFEEMEDACEIEASNSMATPKSTRIKKMEDECEGIMKPSRFITIAFRLFEVQVRDNRKAPGGASPNLQKVKTGQFTQIIGNEAGLKEFVNFLDSNFLGKKNCYLQKYKKLLKYDATKNTNGLPYVTFLRLAKQAPELVFVLLYRLLIKKDYFNESNKKLVLAVMTALMFFGRKHYENENKKVNKEYNYQQLLRRIWPAVVELNADEFWGEKTMARALLIGGKDAEADEGETAIRKPQNLLASLKKELNDLEKQKKSKGKMIDEYYKAINPYRRIIDEDHFLLYAQRAYLDKWFKDMAFVLDETNIPYDYDHILPQNMNRNNILKKLKAVYNTIGNKRAWPYSLNRKDQDKGLYIKFNPLSPEHFSNDKDGKDKEQNFWDNDCRYFDTDKQDRKNPWPAPDLKKVLLEESLCLPGRSFWRTADNIENEELQILAFEAILHRNFFIYKNWFTDLEVDKIIPSKKKDEIKKFFNACFRNRVNILKEPVFKQEILPFVAVDLKYHKITLAIENYENLIDENNLELAVSFKYITDCEYSQAENELEHRQENAKKAGWLKWKKDGALAFYKYYTLAATGSHVSNNNVLEKMLQDIKYLRIADLAKDFKECLNL